MGTKAEIDSAGGGADPQQPDEALYTLLRDWYDGQYPNEMCIRDRIISRRAISPA